MRDELRRDQLNKLATVLHVPSSRIDYLGCLSGTELAELREAVVRLLHTRYPREYRRYTFFARRVPLRFALPLATRVLPPRILGRALSANLLDGRSDAALAPLADIDPAVVADVAPFLDPAVVVRLAEFSSPELIDGVLTELMAREDFDTADMFVDTFTSYLMTNTQGVPTGGAVTGSARGAKNLLRGFGRHP